MARFRSRTAFCPRCCCSRATPPIAIGKWHLTPSEQISAAGPYDRWPLGRGFERYYGFLGGDTHQYYPDLVYDNHQVEPPKTPEEGYHLTADLADKAIGFIADLKQVAPDKPFFLYFAPGANHAPHHVRKEWSDKYKGKFDEGWDVYREKVFARQKELGIMPKDAKLSRHDPDVQEWAKLPADERKLYARMMEVFAGFCEHMDHHVGRLIDFLEQMGELDNTLIMFISDNGASSEGGPNGSVNENKFFNNVPDDLKQNLAAIDELGGPKYFNHYAWGWTHAGNTPFKRWKRETYRGGDRRSLHRPLAERHQEHGQGLSANSLTPSTWSRPCSRRSASKRRRMFGASRHRRSKASASPMSSRTLKAESRHKTQYFEMFAHRSIYHDGWRAVCPLPGTSFKESGSFFGAITLTEDMLRELDAKNWELYDLSKDPTETTDLAASNRPKLIEMIALWYTEAGKYNVFPLDSRGTMRFADERPELTKARKTYVYYPGTQMIPENVAAKLLNKSHSLTADVEIPKGGAEGVLICHGGNVGGYTLFVKDKKLHYVHNYVGAEEFHVVSNADVPEGKVSLRYEFEKTGEPDFKTGKGAAGKAQLYINKKLVGETTLPYTVPLALGIGSGVFIGRNSGSPVSPLYGPPFEFTGTIHQVTVDVSGKLIEDSEEQKHAVAKMAMARQ